MIPGDPCSSEDTSGERSNSSSDHSPLVGPSDEEARYLDADPAAADMLVPPSIGAANNLFLQLGENRSGQGQKRDDATCQDLILVALPYFAVIYTGAAIVAQCMPLLLSYGASPELVTGLFVLVCIIAFVLQPMIGATSDNPNRYPNPNPNPHTNPTWTLGALSDGSQNEHGRRRPYIAVIFLIMLITQVVYILPAYLPLSAPLCNGTSVVPDSRLAESDGLTSADGGVDASNHFLEITLVFLGGLGMSICVNVVQVPLRARAIEIASADQQDVIHAIFSAFAGLGAGAAYVVAYIIDPISHSGLYFSLAIVLNVATFSASLLFLGEDNPNIEPSTVGSRDRVPELGTSSDTAIEDTTSTEEARPADRGEGRTGVRVMVMVMVRVRKTRR